MTLSAPFPWFGGKSRAADLVWQRFGNVSNYVEPFAGSLAVLLSRPHAPGTETVNDADCFLANFWRSVQHAPDETAAWADAPVNEADLHARHRWLVSREEFRERMKADPEFYDAKIAGWWVWGVACWIGSGWCSRPEWEGRAAVAGSAGERGIHGRRERGQGAPSQQLPHLGNAGMGLHRKLPHLGDAGRGEVVAAWFGALADRLARVRVACGDWTRVMGDSVTLRLGVAGILLDPPYSSDEHSVEYAAHSDVGAAVREWALEHGDDPRLRIALCGYAGEHSMPAGWEEVAWKARGGYGSQGDGRGRENALRERIWFSPHCRRTTLFSEATA